MTHHFLDLCLAAYQKEGQCGLINVWLNVVNDTFKNAPREQWTALHDGGMMQTRTSLLIILALLGSLLVATIDTHATKVYAALMVMLPITFILSFIQPKRAWLWALIIGLSVPLSFLWHVLMGTTYAAPPTNGFTTLIALVPAFIGAFSGAILRKILELITAPMD